MLVEIPIFAAVQETLPTSVPTTQPRVVPDQGFLAMFMSTGWVGIVMLGIGIAAIVMIYRRSRALQLDVMMPEKLRTNVAEALSKGNFDEAAAMCRADSSLLGRVLTGGYSMREFDIDDMIGGAERASAREMMLLAASVAQLARWAIGVFLFGLFGGSLAAISGLKMLTVMSSPTQSDFAACFTYAFVNVAFGTLLAMVFLAAFFVLDARLARRVASVQEVGEEFVLRAVRSRPPKKA